MSRWIAALLLVVSIGAAPVSAQEGRASALTQDQQASLLRAAFTATDSAVTPEPASLSLADAFAPSQSIAQSVINLPSPMKRSNGTLNALCVSFAALQVLDLQTTFKALDKGAREANPIIGGFAGNKGAMIGFKAATTAGTIYLVRKFGVKNRVLSTVFMAVTNSVYAMIAAHNYRVAHTIR